MNRYIFMEAKNYRQLKIRIITEDKKGNARFTTKFYFYKSPFTEFLYRKGLTMDCVYDSDLNCLKDMSIINFNMGYNLVNIHPILKKIAGKLCNRYIQNN